MTTDVRPDPNGSRVDIYRGVDDSIRAWLWARIRRFVLERDHYTCQVCGADLHDGDPQVHHIAWRRWNGGDHPKNLMTICERCHRNIHEKKRLRDVP